MNRMIMKDYLSHEPTTLSNSYIFLTDNSDLALMIAGSGFGSQALLEDPDDCKDFFSVQSFVDYLGSDESLPAFKSRKMISWRPSSRQTRSLHVSPGGVSSKTGNIWQKWIIRKSL